MGNTIEEMIVYAIYQQFRVRPLQVDIAHARKALEHLSMVPVIAYGHEDTQILILTQDFNDLNITFDVKTLSFDCENLSYTVS